MARMIPPCLSPSVRSNAERRIFRLFLSAPRTNQWIVLHSLWLADHKTEMLGETDFLVLAPDLGLYALEVKGGRVRRENGLWYFTNRFNHTNCSQRGPFEQASEGAYSIIRHLKTRLDPDHAHLSHLLYGYGVMTPDIHFTASGPDQAPWQIFDKKNGADVAGFLRTLATETRAQRESRFGPLPEGSLPSAEDVRYMASLLRSDLDFVVPLRDRLQQTDDALLSLTKEQYACLDALEDNPRCLITGPAGTGKTLLAVEAAKRAAAQGERVALLCYNHMLGLHLSHLCPQVAFAGTLHRYMTRVTGLDPAEKDDTFFDQTLPRAAQAALEQNGAEFDRMVADEAQDLIPWLGVLDRCLKGGLERGKWTLFGDFSRQAIYADDQTPEDLLAQLEDMASFARYRLNLNCRNTREMCRVLETITGFDPGRPMRYEVSGGPVRSILWKTREEELEKLEDLLKELHHEQIPPEKITILSPVRRETSVVAGVTAFPIDDFQVPPSGYITFSTIHGFKGLENTVILLTDMENYNNRTLLYVGLSRATARLYVFQNKKADQQYGELLIRRLISKDGGYQT